MIRANCGVQGQNRTVGIGRHVFKMERSQLYLLKKKKQNDKKLPYKPSFKCSCGFRNSQKATERPMC